MRRRRDNLVESIPSGSVHAVGLCTRTAQQRYPPQSHLIDKADRAVHQHQPFLVDRRMLKHVATEKFHVDDARIVFIGSGTFHAHQSVRDSPSSSLSQAPLIRYTYHLVPVRIPVVGVPLGLFSTMEFLRKQRTCPVHRTFIEMQTNTRILMSKVAKSPNLLVDAQFDAVKGVEPRVLRYWIPSHHPWFAGTVSLNDLAVDLTCKLQEISLGHCMQADTRSLSPLEDD